MPVQKKSTAKKTAKQSRSSAAKKAPARKAAATGTGARKPAASKKPSTAKTPAKSNTAKPSPAKSNTAKSNTAKSNTAKSNSKVAAKKAAPAKKAGAGTSSGASKRSAPAKKAASAAKRSTTQRSSAKNVTTKKVSNNNVASNQQTATKSNSTASKSPTTAKRVTGAPAANSTTVELPKPKFSKSGIGYTKDFPLAFVKSAYDSLQEERTRLTGQANRLESEAQKLVEDGEMGDVQFDDEGGEGDTLAVEREQDLTLSAQARETVREIDLALERIAKGTFGYSTMSGLPIPMERLEAIPWSTVLVEEKVGGIGRR